MNRVNQKCPRGEVPVPGSETKPDRSRKSGLIFYDLEATLDSLQQLETVLFCHDIITKKDVWCSIMFTENSENKARIGIFETHSDLSFAFHGRS